MERMEERVPDSDEQQLRQMLTDSEIVKLFKPQIRHRWYTADQSSTAAKHHR